MVPAALKSMFTGPRAWGKGIRDLVAGIGYKRDLLGPVPSMNRRELVLAMLACAGGRPYSPVQIQKAVFVVCENMPRLVDQGPGFNFEPYDYGPFDSAIYTELEALRTEGAAVITPSPFGNWNLYAATDEGASRGNRLLEQIGPARDYLKKVSDWVRSQSFSSLVKSIYEAYPKMRARSIFRG